MKRAVSSKGTPGSVGRRDRSVIVVGAATHAGGCVGCSGEIERVKLKKDSTVIVVAGDDKGQTGTLYGIDGDDGIVQLTDDIKILVLNTLAEHVPL